MVKLYIMLTIHKKYIVDEQGHPTEVVISYQDFLEIEELLGLDLDDEAVTDLQTARRDRETGNTSAYVDLDAI